MCAQSPIHVCACRLRRAQFVCVRASIGYTHNFIPSNIRRFFSRSSSSNQSSRDNYRVKMCSKPTKIPKLVKYGILEEIDGRNVKISQDNNSFEISADDIILYEKYDEGDFLQLHYENGDLVRIEPHERGTYVGRVEKLSDKYGVIGEDTIFGIKRNTVLSIGDLVSCDRIKGEYVVDNEIEYAFRCIDYEKTQLKDEPLKSVEFGVLEEIDGRILKISRDKNSFEINADEITVYESYGKGDFLQLHYENDKLVEIEPNERGTYVDRIEKLFDKYGVVGEDTVFDIKCDIDLSIGDLLSCDRVKGEYGGDNDCEYGFRCIGYESVRWHDEPDVPRNYVPYTSDIVKEFEEPYSNMMDRDFHIPMRYRDAKHPNKIHKKLIDDLPDKLNVSTYTTHFHNLLYMEELRLEKEFDDHKRSNVTFRLKSQNEPNQRIFQMEFENLHEKRPSLLKGDDVFASITGTRQMFRGYIRKTMRDALDISFFDDFTDVFDEAMTFDVAFGYSRGNYRKMHKAVELAVKRLSEKILFPHDIDAANAAQIDVQLGGDDELMLNGVPIPWFQKHLDTSQKAAVVRALRAEFNPMPTIIHGPPGTGKTTTLIEIILHVFTQLPENRMLVAAHSNSAANLLLRRLIEYDFLHESIVRVVGICYQEKGTLDAALEPYCVCLDSKDHPGENDIKVKMLKDTSELAPFRIIIGTCVGFGALMFDRTLPDFAHVIIDEAGQCTEPEALIPILRVNATNGSVILAGDQMQMAPLILSKHARMHGLSLSLLERLIGVYASFEVQSKPDDTHVNPSLVSKLVFNYRSSPSILAFYNHHFYNNELSATVSDVDSEESKILMRMQEIIPVNSKRNQKHAIFFHNVFGKNYQTTESNSWYNQDECIVVHAVVASLKRLHFADEEIGVITPYRLQVKTMRKVIEPDHPGVKVGSVDEYQGMEKKIIVISTVRTDANKMQDDICRQLGIVACPKRINVAISRARAAVLVVGRADLLQRDRYWRSLIDTCKSNGTFYET